jgi:hypothetical protein
MEAATVMAARRRTSSRMARGSSRKVSRSWARKTCADSGRTMPAAFSAAAAATARRAPAAQPLRPRSAV